MKLTRKELKKIIFESINSKVTMETTVTELISGGYLTIADVERFNRKIAKGVETVKGELTQDRANQAVAFFLSITYGIVPAGVAFHTVRKQRDAQGKKIGFGLKETEKALAQHGITRKMIEVAFAKLVQAGALTNNANDISNNAHKRHGRMLERTNIIADFDDYVEEDILTAEYFIKDYNILMQFAIA